MTRVRVEYLITIGDRKYLSYLDTGQLRTGTGLATAYRTVEVDDELGLGMAMAREDLTTGRTKLLYIHPAVPYTIEEVIDG